MKKQFLITATLGFLIPCATEAMNSKNDHLTIKKIHKETFLSNMSKLMDDISNVSIDSKIKPLLELNKIFTDGAKLIEQESAKVFNDCYKNKIKKQIEDNKQSIKICEEKIKFHKETIKKERVDITESLSPEKLSSRIIRIPQEDFVYLKKIITKNNALIKKNEEEIKKLLEENQIYEKGIDLVGNLNKAISQATF